MDTFDVSKLEDSVQGSCLSGYLLSQLYFFAVGQNYSKQLGAAVTKYEKCLLANWVLL